MAEKESKEEKLAKLKELKKSEIDEIEAGDKKDLIEAKHDAEVEVREVVEFELSELPGVGAVRQKRLEEAGIHTPLDLMIAGPLEVASITGMEVDQTEALDKVAREFLQDKNIVKNTFAKATDVLNYRKTVIDTNRISTGSKNLDKFFGGGIEPQAITELYGLFGSGKTQMAHTLAVTNSLPKGEGGRDGEVLWFDTEGTFRPERIREIVIERGLVPLKDKVKKSDDNEAVDEKDVLKFLDRITVAKVYNSSHQLMLVNELSNMLNEDRKEKKEGDHPFTLIIVDSLMTHFRAEYIGRGLLAPRQSKLGKYMKKLIKIAESFNIAVVITNQVTANPDGFSAPIKPVGGNIVGHASTYRVFLKKSGAKRIARMDDSPMHEQSEIPFLMTKAGVQDVDDG